MPIWIVAANAVASRLPYRDILQCRLIVPIMEILATNVVASRLPNHDLLQRRPFVPIMEILPTNVVASRPPERRLTVPLTANYFSVTLSLVCFLSC